MARISSHSHLRLNAAILGVCEGKLMCNVARMMRKKTHTRLLGGVQDELIVL